MPEYGELRVDYITYTTGTFPSEGKGTVTVSGLINNPTFSGNVIVGNDLTVSGDINASGVTISGITGLFASGTEAAPSISFIGDTDTGVYSPGANQVAISTNGSGRLFVDANGHVGVGTATPSELLTVWGGNILTDANSRKIGFKLTGNTNAGYLIPYDSSGNTQLINERSSGNLIFKTANTERARIDSSGRLGLGTSTPSQKLHVSASSGDVTALVECPGHPILRLKTTGTTDNTSVDFADGDSDTAGRLIYTHGTELFSLYNGGSNRLTVTSAGNVGIGTTSPDVELSIQSSSINCVTKLKGTSSTNGSQIQVNSSDFLLRNRDNGSLQFWTNDSQKAQIDSSGRLGVGTSSPSETIHVNGTLRTTNLKISGSTFGPADLSGSLTIAPHVVNIDQIGGDITLTTGAAGTRFGGTGDIYIKTEDASNQPSGSINISTGGNNGSTTPGPILLTAGSSSYTGGAGQDGGLIQLSAGNAVSVVNSNKYGGDVIIRPGTNTASSAFNGHFYIQRSTDAVTYVNCLDVDTSGGTTTFTSAAATSPFIAKINTSEVARIDSSGRLLVGTSAARLGNVYASLQLEGSNSGTSKSSIIGRQSGIPQLFLGFHGGTANGQTTLVANGNSVGQISFNGADGTDFRIAATITGQIDGTPGANDMPGRLVFSTTADGASSPTERMRISANGRAVIGASNYSVVGAFSASDTGFNVENDGGTVINRSDNTVLYIGRQTSDGTLVSFQQAGTAEGTISVSGTTVSYNGAHLSRWSQLVGIDPYDKTARPEILRGTVMSNLDEMCDWTCPTSGDCQDNEQLNKTEISSVDDDPNVAGVFQSWDDDDDTWLNDFYLAMTGDFVIRIAAGTTVQRGDLLCSAGDGTARPQGDRYLKDSTIAKVTSTAVSCTHPDGSYCVPCVLMAC